MDGARKRRKWDVPAPGGMPLSGNRAGIGSGTTAKKQGMSGFITAQGLQTDPPEHSSSVAAGTVPPAAVPSPKPLSEQEIIERAKQEAQAVVERINAQARAKGQMPASRGQSRFPDDSEKIFREVNINDAPQHIRFELIKRSVQDDIQRRTHTIVVIKGRYQQVPIPNDLEGPLRLRVMPGNVGPDDMIKQRAVDNGAQEIRRILQGGNSRHPPQQGPAGHAAPFGHAPPPDRLSGFIPAGGQQAPPMQQQQQPVPAPMQQPPRPAPAPWQQPAQTVSLYVGVEAPPEFNMIFKLRGPGDSYLLHISSTTGAEVTLRGRGAGGIYDSPDHLHMVVAASNPKSFEDAKGLSVNLIDTVRAEHAKFMASLPPPTALQQAPGPSQPPQQQMQQPASMPMHSQAPSQPQLQSHQQAPSPANQPPSPANQPPSPANQPPGSPGSRPAGNQLQHPPGPNYQQAQGGYPASQQPPEHAAGSYPQQYPPSSAHVASAPHPLPDSRPQPVYGMMHQPAGLPHPLQAPAPSQLMPSHPGQQQMPSHQSNAAYPPQNVAYPPAAYASRPTGQGAPFGARPAFSFAPSAAYQPQGAGQYLPQQQQGGYAQGAPPAHALGPMHGPQRPPNMGSDRAGGALPDERGTASEQDARHRLHHNGMSASDLQAQQERKRRFTEKSAKNGWKQGMTQQPVMPGFANQPPAPQPAAPAADPNPPLPMGPPPPRPPVQFKLGAMGPPPPRFNIRMQGPPPGAASSGPVQGLVPYGDDD